MSWFLVCLPWTGTHTFALLISILDIWFHRYDENGKDIEGRCMAPTRNVRILLTDIHR